MAFWRLLKNSVKFAFRAKKRWVTFVVIFALLSSFITLFVSTFNVYATEELMDHKGFYLKAQGTGSITEAQGTNFVSEIEQLEEVEKVALFRYFDLGDYIRVFSVEPDSKWMFLEAKPSTIEIGDYLSNDKEALVSIGANIRADVGVIPANVSASLHMGEVLSFITSTQELSIEIVGEIDDNINGPGKFKLFVTDTTFDIIQEEFSNNANVYCYSLGVLVKGSLFKPFNKDIYSNIEALAPQSSLLWIDPEDSAQIAEYGAWSEPDFEPAETMRKARSTDLLYFIVGILGGIVLVILYNALIVWFRKREIAVLRAMGYKKNEIRINLIGESMTISFIGFLLGILTMLVYFYTQDMTFTNQILTPITILISFGIVVVLSIPGLLLTSISFTRVNPILLFKAR